MKEQHTDRKRVWTEKSDNLTSEWKRLAKMTPQEYYAEFKAKQVHLRIFKEVDFFKLISIGTSTTAACKRRGREKAKRSRKGKRRSGKGRKRYFIIVCVFT